MSNFFVKKTIFYFINGLFGINLIAYFFKFHIDKFGSFRPENYILFSGLIGIVIANSLIQRVLVTKRNTFVFIALILLKLLEIYTLVATVLVGLLTKSKFYYNYFENKETFYIIEYASFTLIGLCVCYALRSFFVTNCKKCKKWGTRILIRKTLTGVHKYNYSTTERVRVTDYLGTSTHGYADVPVTKEGVRSEYSRDYKCYCCNHQWRG